MSADDAPERKRIAQLETRVRRLQRTVVFVVVTFLGFVLLQGAGWLPLRGSSLRIGTADDGLLVVSRVPGMTGLFLSGDSGRSSASLLVGRALSQMVLKSEGGGTAQVYATGETASASLSGKADGRVQLSTAGGRPFASLSSGPDRRRLILTTGCEGPEISVVDRDDWQNKRAPLMPGSAVDQPGARTPQSSGVEGSR